MKKVVFAAFVLAITLSWPTQATAAENCGYGGLGDGARLIPAHILTGKAGKNQIACEKLGEGGGELGGGHIAGAFGEG